MHMLFLLFRSDQLEECIYRGDLLVKHIVSQNNFKLNFIFFLNFQNFILKVGCYFLYFSKNSEKSHPSNFPSYRKTYRKSLVSCIVNNLTTIAFHISNTHRRVYMSYFLRNFTYVSCICWDSRHHARNPQLERNNKRKTNSTNEWIKTYLSFGIYLP